MTHRADEIEALENDGALNEPLRRVAYEAGMLLGLEATQAEQDYHRRRLNRHQYWLNGMGTLAGMVVAIDPPTTTQTSAILTRMTISPGIGIDGLGREILVNESYCIDLGKWLTTRTEAELLEGYDDDEDTLWLKVTARYKPCEVAKQPVLSRKLNLSTDAVQPSRLADSVALELMAEIPPAPESRYQPWAANDPVEDDRPAALTETEINLLDSVAGNAALAQQLELHARLLHALGEGGVSAPINADNIKDKVNLLLARVAIDIPDLNTILNAEDDDPVVNPNNIHVNNLIRPFLVTASQLAFLHSTARL